MQLTIDTAAAHLRAATLALVGEGQGVRFGIAVSGGPDSMALLHLERMGIKAEDDEAEDDEAMQAGPIAIAVDVNEADTPTNANADHPTP